jgi:two-component system response regulator NreC
MPYRVVLADDHVVVREGLKSLLERQGFSVVGEASDGREAARITREVRPDVAVLDLTMPVLNGLDAAREIQQTTPSTKTVLLTMHNEEQYVLSALRCGITGYVLKSRASSSLVEALREVCQGNVYLSPGISRAVVSAFLNGAEAPAEPLSPREREVLQLIAEGQTTKEVATILGVSVKTAESHRSRIMEKLNIHQTAGLVRYAIRKGLIEP